jgi:hypothetical protein
VLNMPTPRRDAFDPNSRGYHAVYRAGEVNHCPGCGRTHWMIGRLLAAAGRQPPPRPVGDGGASFVAGLSAAGRRLSPDQKAVSSERPREYILPTMRVLPICAAAAFAAMLPVPAAAQAGNFTIVNATGIDFTGLAVRRFGTTEWLPLTVSPVPLTKAGRGAASFRDEDCAFDLRANLPDGRTVVWPGVNLCQVKVVTLNQKAGGALWVDYE